MNCKVIQLLVGFVCLSLVLAELLRVSPMPPSGEKPLNWLCVIVGWRISNIPILIFTHPKEFREGAFHWVRVIEACPTRRPSPQKIGCHYLQMKSSFLCLKSCDDCVWEIPSRKLELWWQLPAHWRDLVPSSWSTSLLASQYFTRNSKIMEIDSVRLYSRILELSKPLPMFQSWSLVYFTKQSNVTSNFC